jgi:CBS domain containing-hemolysin-like protein
LLGITSGLIKVTIIITYPLVWVSSLITKLISKKHSGPTTSREEISALASIGVKEGIFKSKENAIIQNIIKLKSLKIEEIMTPRIVVETADEDMTLQQFFGQKDKFHFSRIPIYRGEKDMVTGYVMRQKVFEKLVEEQKDLKLKDIKRDLLQFPKHTTLFDAWETMIQKKAHISVIQGMYGGIIGLVTFEDILESLLGVEIVDETDMAVDMQEYARKKWQEQQGK